MYYHNEWMTTYTWTVQWQGQWMHVVNWLLARRCHLLVQTHYSNDEIKYEDNNDDKLDLLQFYQ